MPHHDEQSTRESADRIARLLLDENQEALQATKNALKRRLMREAMRGALEELGDAEAMADMVYQQLGADNEAVRRASEAVQNRLLDDIARRSLEPLQDPEATARAVVARLDKSDEQVRASEQSARDLVLKQVLSDALQEIEEEMSADDEGDDLIPIPIAGHEHRVDEPAAVEPDSDVASGEDSHPEVRAPHAETNDEPPAGGDQSEPELSLDEMEHELVVSDPNRASSGNAALEERPTWVNRVSYQDAVVSQLREPDTQRERPYYYTYGVVAEEIPSDVLDGSGIQPENSPYLLRCGTVFAVVSKVDGLPFAIAERDAKLREPAVKRAYKTAHIRVLEAISNAGFTVVPRPYGTIVQTEEKVCSTIEAQAEIFEEAVERLSGRQEWSVQLFRSQAAQPQSQQRRPVGLYASSDAFASYDVGLEAGRESDGNGESSGLVAVIKRSIFNALQSSAVDATMNATYDAPSDKGLMVLNAAYLVDSDGEKEFLETAERLNERQRALGFSLEWSGPRVPLSFWQ